MTGCRKDRKLLSGLHQLGLEPTERQLRQIEQLFQLLQRWNRAYNLTRITTWDHFLTRHLFDSLAALPYLKGERTLDVGTGAGFPGLPLAIFSPQPTFTLLDAVAKKVDFVEMAVLELGLTNVEAVHARIEAFRPSEPFQTIVSRAVGSLLELWKSCARLLAGGGRLVVYKGKHPSEELAELPREVRYRVVPVEVPFLRAERHLVIIETQNPEELD